MQETEGWRSRLFHGATSPRLRVWRQRNRTWQMQPANPVFRPKRMRRKWVLAPNWTCHSSKVTQRWWRLLSIEGSAKKDIDLSRNSVLIDRIYWSVQFRMIMSWNPWLILPTAVVLTTFSLVKITVLSKIIKLIPFSSFTVASTVFVN